MNKKQMGIFVLSGIVIIIISFYWGMKYGMTKTIANSFSKNGFGNMKNVGEGRQGMQMQKDQRDNIGQRQNMGEMFLSGEVISKDGNSINIKTQNGDSKIILLTDALVVEKNITSSLDDVIIGKNILVNGKNEQGNNFIAKNIQIKN